jgi:predicted pyridoxine 5'-phosphate oxidase superfamily flavin-nucleotide-binding protein
MPIKNPYHEGELLVQQRVGELQEAQQNGQIICDAILKGALKFIEQQPMVVFGSVDDQQNVWASVLVGRPGFIMAVDQRTVELDFTQTACNWQDPFWTNIEYCSQVGMLVIEFTTRRRLRINGRVTHTAQKRLRLDVAESYPNCPKYIQRRHITYIGNTSSCLSSLREGQLFEPDQQAFIASADTFFIASVHPTRGVDASHRGGNPGFIRILDNKTIRIPDYAGNSMFNTLGNFMVNPRAGLIFLDFERSRTLQLIGRSEILWGLDDPTHKTGGTKRYWNFKIERWLEMNLPQLLHWEFLDYSPHNPS